MYIIEIDNWQYRGWLFKSSIYINKIKQLKITCVHLKMNIESLKQ